MVVRKQPAKMTKAQDRKFDKKYGIKGGSPLDTQLDAKLVGKKPKKATPKKK